MTTLITIAAAAFRDAALRGSFVLLLGGGAVAMLALRYVAIYALGEELLLLKELGLSNLSLLGALTAILCAAPAGRVASIQAADRVLFTRPLSPQTVALGRWFGSCAVLALYSLFWFIMLAVAVWWYAAAEPTLFTMQEPTTAWRETGRLAGPALLVLMQGMMLAGIAHGASALGELPGAVAAVAVTMVAGVLVPGWLATGPASGIPGGATAAGAEVPWLLSMFGAVVPDLRYYSPGDVLYNVSIGPAWYLKALVQAAGYGGAAACAGGLFLRRG